MYNHLESQFCAHNADTQPQIPRGTYLNLILAEKLAKPLICQNPVIVLQILEAVFHRPGKGISGGPQSSAIDWKETDSRFFYSDTWTLPVPDCFIKSSIIWHRCSTSITPLTVF